MREQAEVEVYWAGLTTAVSFLYALWPAYAISPKPGGHVDGWGLPVVYVLIGIVFCIALAAAGLAFQAVVRLDVPPLALLGIFAAAICIFLVGFGRPSVLTLMVTAVFFAFGCIQQLRDRREAGDLEQFMNEDE
jgi:hypothetical protein